MHVVTRIFSEIISNTSNHAFQRYCRGNQPVKLRKAHSQLCVCCPALACPDVLVLVISELALQTRIIFGGLGEFYSSLFH